MTSILGDASTFGEVQFVLSLIKVIAVIGFNILGIVVACGGGPEGGFIGGKYWHDPGAFANGFKGFASCFVSSSFAFSGTELVGLAASEMSNPRKDLPRAAKQVFIRILLFYIVTVIIIGCLVPYTDKQLMGSGAVVDVNASPFVIAIQNAGIKVLPSIFNAVVLLSVISVGSSSVYAASRSISALGQAGQLPSWLGFIDRKGRPMVGIIIALAFGLISFVVAAGQDVQNEVFDWLMAISGLSALFTWGCCCLCHIMIDLAMKKQGRSMKELVFTGQLGVYGGYYGFFMMIFILGIQFWIALFPLDEEPSARGFFKVYVSFPIAFVCGMGYWLIFRTPCSLPSTIDLDTGRRVMTVEEVETEKQAEKEYIKSRGAWYRIYKFFC